MPFEANSFMLVHGRTQSLGSAMVIHLSAEGTVRTPIAAFVLCNSKFRCQSLCKDTPFSYMLHVAAEISSHQKV